MINKTYLQATKNWKSLIDLKHTQKITKHLNGGTFTISREEYNTFDKTSDRVHYYFGLISDELYVFITDKNNDAKKDHSKVLVKKMSHSIDPSTLVDVDIKMPQEMSTEAYLRRLFNWNLFSYNWIENQLNKGLLFEGISNPFEDLSKIFDKSEVHNVYHFFGLQHIKAKGLTAVVDSDFSKYKINLFCSYICSKDKREVNFDLSWPHFSNKKLNKDKNAVYSLYEGY